MRRQLALVMVATTSLVVLSLLIPLGKAVSTIPRDRAISEAQLTSQSLVQAIVAVRDHARLETLVEQTSDLNGRAVSVLMPDGSTLGPAFASTPGVVQARGGRALTARIHGGVEVLTPAVLEDGTAVVRVAVPDSVLRRGVLSAWAVLAALGALLILVAVVVADRLARSIVKPIDALAATTRALERGQLDARVEPAGPAEVREVGYTLNLLADRIGELLISEREAVADLSHRLRTPITALRLDAEGLSDPAEAGRITADVDELTKAVDNLIRTARQPMQSAASSCDLVEVVRERTFFWQALADEQERHLRVRVPEGPLRVGLSADALGAALDALIGNVFAHTDDGIAFALHVQVRGDRVVLDVDDSGPGLRRDAEVRGVSGSGSTGLGLSIVRSTMENAGGQLTLSRSPSGGTRASVQLTLIRQR